MLEIYLDNFVSCLAWAFHYSDLKSLETNQVKYLSDIGKEMYDKFELSDQVGFNPNIMHCSLSLHDIKYFHHSLLLGLCVNSYERYFEQTFLKRNNFKKYKIFDMIYWVFENKTSNKPPFMLFHGITIGWNRYANLIKTLSNESSVILVNNDCVKLFSLNFNIPDYQMVIKLVNHILQVHNFNQISLIAHSWGTFWAPWIVKCMPDKIAHLTLIDNVSTFVLLSPEIMYYICYKPPVTFTDYFVYYFLRHDLTIANNWRYLRWYNSILDYDDIPLDIPTIICISGKDELLNVPAALEITDVHISSRPSHSKPFIKLYFPDLEHGDIISNIKSITTLVQTINRTL